MWGEKAVSEKQEEYPALGVGNGLGEVSCGAVQGWVTGRTN